MQTILLVDIDERPIPESGGKKEKYVSHANQFSAEVQLVGQDTYWKAQQTNIVLKHSIKIRRKFFNNESFLWLNNKLYKIVNLGKSAAPDYILLNVSEHVDGGITAAIERWLNENTTV